MWDDIEIGAMPVVVESREGNLLDIVDVSSSVIPDVVKIVVRLVNLPRLKSQASLSVRPEGPRKRKMTPHPCTQRAPDGFPDRLTAACSCGRLGCTGGWDHHAGYPAIWEAASASLYVARVTLVLFAASGTFAVTRDQPSFPRLDSRSRMR